MLIREMTSEDYDAVYALWQATEGLGLSDADSREAIARYLERNPGLSFIAVENEELLGTVLCGHDGRRGYLHHLAVARSHRGQGLGRRLAQRALAALQAVDIHKCHLFVIKSNAPALAFWEANEWQVRTDIQILSKFLR